MLKSKTSKIYVNKFPWYKPDAFAFSYLHLSLSPHRLFARPLFCQNSTSQIVKMSTKLKVFLDSNVVLKYLRANEDVEFLFSSETLSKVTYCVNPIVIQEILLAQPAYPKRNLDEFKNYLEIKELNKEASDEIFSRVKQIRNKIVHTNDLLILGSAAECDFIITSDKDILDLTTQDNVEGVNAITPQEFEEKILPEL